MKAKGIAQREITTSLENAFEARWQRILISRSQVHWTKWAALLLQAACALIAIAMVHSDKRLSSANHIGNVCDRGRCVRVFNRRIRSALCRQLAVGLAPLLEVMP